MSSREPWKGAECHRKNCLFSPALLFATISGTEGRSASGATHYTHGHALCGIAIRDWARRFGAAIRRGDSANSASQSGGFARVAAEKNCAGGSAGSAKVGAVMRRRDRLRSSRPVLAMSRNGGSHDLMRKGRFALQSMWRSAFMREGYLVGLSCRMVYVG